MIALWTNMRVITVEDKDTEAPLTEGEWEEYAQPYTVRLLHSWLLSTTSPPR